MHRKLFPILAFVLLCGPYSARGFEVFQDPSNTGTNPGIPAAVPTTGSTVNLNLWVSEPGTFYGYELRIEATGALEIQTFIADPDVVANTQPPSLLRLNRVDPTTGQSGSLRVGTLAVRATGTGSLDLTGNVFINSSVASAPIPTGPLASTNACDPTADTDSDGFDDCADNCPFRSNPGQEDNGGVGTTAADGTGDVCQCGDINGNGVVNSTDAVLIKRSIALLSPYFSIGGMPEPDNCDVNGVSDDTCSSTDVVIIKRALVGLSPGIKQVCPNAEP